MGKDITSTQKVTRDKLEGKTFYATVGDKCNRIPSEGHEVVLELQIPTRRSRWKASRPCIQAVYNLSEDIDVFIISVAFHDKIVAP